MYGSPIQCAKESANAHCQRVPEKCHVRCVLPGRSVFGYRGVRSCAGRASLGPTGMFIQLNFDCSDILCGAISCSVVELSTRFY